MTDMTPEAWAESAPLRAAIWRELQENNPAAVVDAFNALLAFVEKRNARDPWTMITALAGNLTLGADVVRSDPATAKLIVLH